MTHQDVGDMARDVLDTQCPGCSTCQERAKAVAAAFFELGGRLDAVVALHRQSSTIGLADGEWCPADGFDDPCPTLRAATGWPL